jgi:hypothetical protein
MDLIMTDGANRNQILLDILTTMSMMFNMMQLYVSRISRVPFPMVPSAFLAGILISNKGRPSYRIRNVSIMRRTLPVLFQEVGPDS